MQAQFLYQERYVQRKSDRGHALFWTFVIEHSGSPSPSGPVHVAIAFCRANALVVISNRGIRYLGPYQTRACHSCWSYYSHGSGDLDCRACSHSNMKAGTPETSTSIKAAREELSFARHPICFHAHVGDSPLRGISIIIGSEEASAVH